MNFRFLNISIFIQPAFFLLLFVFCFDPSRTSLQMFIMAAIFTCSIFFHELGHAFAAREFGRWPEITFEGLGAYTSYEPMGLSDKQRFLITLCGPLFTALLAGVSYYLYRIGVSPSLCLYITQLNLFWLIVQLAPLKPLDGGRILEHFASPSVCRKIGHGAAFLGSLYFLLSGSYIFAYVFLFYGWQNWQSAPRDTINPFVLYNEALRALENRESKKAETLFAQLIKSKDDYIKARSLEGLAQILNQNGQEQKAYKLLLKAPENQLSYGKKLLCKLAYSQKNYALAEKYSLEIYNAEPSFETALLNAKTFAKLARSSHAIAWLKTALKFPEAKEHSLDTLLSDAAFHSIRSEPEFLEIFKAEETLHETSQ